ncbi:hypothetical protein [Bifidobacterium myosotis]|uniref:Uncharacterized protein n=1 Tax=Bifidobacterium myosotis TaxID=1630166 RepID=A0A5M9ZH18_9BIFI|nr:hypothetical protein [Bifidobacterium myosotis]KAA8826907.1 hypothetical protein EMO91_10255 [Bifidobacterium myosotis]
MAVDRNGMSHRPAGTPDAGRFDGAASHASADDVEPPAGAPGRGGRDRAYAALEERGLTALPAAGGALVVDAAGSRGRRRVLAEPDGRGGWNVRRQSWRPPTFREFNLSGRRDGPRTTFGENVLANVSELLRPRDERCMWMDEDWRGADDWGEPAGDERAMADMAAAWLRD